MAEAAVGHGVTAIHKGVDVDLHQFLLPGKTQQGVEVALVRVDASVGEQADHVECSSLLRGEFAGASQGGVSVETAVGDGGVDAGHVHANDASGAEVEVSNLGVAHLAIGEADEVLTGADEGVREVAKELVVGGLAGECDGVAGGFGAVAPAVEDGEYDG